MGSKESKQACISYEDAVKRVSESELLRLQDAFKKSAGAGSVYLTRLAFQREVLFEGVPTDTTNLLYSACGGTSKGITFKDLLCGLVLLTRGTLHEKVKFLWNLYCNDSGSYILKVDFLKAATHPHSYEIGSLFGPNDRVGFDVFQSWIVLHKHATVLSQWLLCDEAIKLTSDLEAPTFYQSLAGVTHLEEKDISDLEKEFWRLKNLSPNGHLDLQLLGPLISPPIPKSALHGLFNAFDENRDGHIDFKELCCGTSAACRGPSVERTRFCFKIFDLDSDGILNNEETLKMITILLYVAKENRNASMYKDLTKDDAINEIIQYSSQFKETKVNSDGVTTEALTSQNITLTAEDFMIWSVESNLKLIQPFLDLTFEVCHIVFGLWPQCRHIEYEIVRGWLKREEKRQQRVGRFWYLISRDWWLNWLHYTQTIGGSCEHCKAFASPTNCHVNGVDEALVCDESFNSNSIDSSAVASDNCSLDSASSGISTGRLYSCRPGPIDNTPLIAPNPLIHIRSLTGEGGHLKRDTPLVQGRDFELVPKSLWKAFNRWYGDTLPLPRQMIQPPNSSVVELELYPLSLKILQHKYTTQVTAARNWSSIPGSYGMMASSYAALPDPTTAVQATPKRTLTFTAAFSHLATVKQIGEFLCQQLNYKLENVRLWHIPSDMAMLDNNAILLEEDQMTLQELIVKDKDQILLEIRNQDLTWPEELSSLAQNNNVPNGDRRLTRSSVLSVHAPGATGLHNLGNTCFMNAALQVLFNTQPLAQYFRRNVHQYELNRSNKLGTRGNLAERYGELLREVWTTNTRSVAPLKLRVCVTKFAPQFSGGGQHDSQELLEWFLDALHEDLNRVTDKPYTELKDSNGRPDEIVAAEAWSQHHSRNQSIIIDLFYGQLKSKVSCLGCSRESVRFDPFSLLSLPLPVENFVYCEVLVILLDGTVPMKYGVRLNSESKYIDLKNHIAPLCLLRPNSMLVCEISNSQISQILTDQQKVKSMSAKNLYVYQLPELNDDDQSFSSSTTFSMSIEQGLKDIQRNSAGIKCHKEVLLKSHSNSQLAPEMENPEVCESFHDSAKGHSTLDGRCNSGNEENTVNDGNDAQGPAKQSSDICRSPTDTPFAKIDSIGKMSSNRLLLQQNSETSLTNDAYENSLDSSISTEPPISMGPQPSSCQSSPRNTIDRPRISMEQKHSVDGDGGSRCGGGGGVNLPMVELQGRDSGSNCWQGGAVVPMMSRMQMNNAKYLMAVHRKITRVDSYFLSHHKTRPSLFGYPILVPLCQSGAYKDLYCAVWLQVSRLLSPLPASSEQANHAADCDDSLGYDFPFTLRAVRRDGVTCALCTWSLFCRGCEIPCKNEDPLSVDSVDGTDTATRSPKTDQYSQSAENPEAKYRMTKLMESENDFAIAIDWDPTALHLRYQSSLERKSEDHDTVAACRKEQTEPVDLDHCLRAFTAEEKLEQWYYCSHCRGKKPATKKLQIWKLPPILIIHLKRFNYVNDKWVKSHKSVHFPFDNFDPTPYLASVPQETIWRHKELQESDKHEHIQPKCEQKIRESINEETTNGYSRSPNNDNQANLSMLSDMKTIRRLSESSLPDEEETECSSTTTTSSAIHPADVDGAMAVSENTRATRHTTRNSDGKRQRLESTSLMRTPVVDGEFEDFHQHKLKPEEDVFDAKYKLYAVVSHSGMLNGGHYISYAANQTGSWYCYNDSSCREISNQPQIDPSSAYLLFYERRGLDYEPYLPATEGRAIASDGNGVGSVLNQNELLDECDNDLKKSCTVS